MVTTRSKASRSTIRTNTVRLTRRPTKQLAAGVVVSIMSCALPMDLAAQDQPLQAASNLQPATLHDFAAQYGAASEAMSAEAVASFYSDSVVSIPYKGVSTTWHGKGEQVEALAGFFSGVKDRGVSSLRLADYTTTQLSNDFATARLRWELTKADSEAVTVVMSTYVLRLEDPGWRAVAILEMGAPQAP